MDYSKFKEKKDCAFPERKHCNYSVDGKIERCPYMKYDNTKNIFNPNRWGCIYKKDTNNDIKGGKSTLS